MAKQKETKKPAVQNKKNNYSFYILLALLMLIITAIRIRLLNIPLERDEGEYAYMGQLILHGTPPYELAYNMKFPGTYYMYAFFMSLFGQTIKGVHSGLLVVNLISIYLIFLLAKKILNHYAAIATAAAFAFLSLGISILGFAAHATHFVTLAAIAGTLFLYKAISDEKRSFYFFSGLFLGLAPIMKQQGILFLLFGGTFLVIHFFMYKKTTFKIFFKKFLIFISGGIIPFAITFIVLSLYGVFGKFWFWTIDYARDYESQIPYHIALSYFKTSFTDIAGDFYLVWIFAAIGIVTLFFHPSLKKNGNILFILLFFVFSFLSVCPGLYFREHYFITLLPSVSLLFGVFISYIFELSRSGQKVYYKYLSYSLLVIPVFMGIYAQKDYYFKYTSKELSAKIYGANPFVESINIAKYIKENSNAYDKIAILGSEPQIFFYADRLSASGYIYTYSLMEDQKNSLKMQKEMISEIERSLPKFFIYVYVPTSWLQHKYSNTTIFEWIKPFLEKNNYMIKGIVDIYSNITVYKWDKDAEDYKLGSDMYVLVFKRES